jgi:hypothetical protein
VGFTTSPFASGVESLSGATTGITFDAILVSAGASMGVNEQGFDPRTASGSFSPDLNINVGALIGVSGETGYTFAGTNNDPQTPDEVFPYYVGM